jgi:hypothetical protein
VIDHLNTWNNKDVTDRAIKVRCQMSGSGGQMSDVRCQGSGVKIQTLETGKLIMPADKRFRNQMSDVRGQKSEFRHWKQEN